jgi:hypothetical protein
MTVDQDVARAARGLFSTKPPSYMHKLAAPQKPEPARLQDDPDWLRARAAEQLSQREIAKLAGCCDTTILTRMRQFHIPPNTRQTKKRGLWMNKEWLYQRRIVEGKKVRDMAAEAGCCHATIRYELDRHGFKPATSGHGPKQAQVVVAEPELHIHRWWERDNEPAESILDCLDCGRPDGGGCEGCENDR